MWGRRRPNPIIGATSSGRGFFEMKGRWKTKASPETLQFMGIIDFREGDHLHAHFVRCAKEDHRHGGSL
jgi:hypothetical protein